VTLASNILEDAQKIASKKERTTACLVDVGNPVNNFVLFFLT